MGCRLWGRTESDTTDVTWWQQQQQQQKQKILRRGGKNTQKNYTKKDLHDPDKHHGVIAHLELAGVRSQVQASV